MYQKLHKGQRLEHVETGNVLIVDKPNVFGKVKARDAAGKVHIFDIPVADSKLCKYRLAGEPEIPAGSSFDC